MDDKTQAMLQQLATKLGTSVEYLWVVMVRGTRVEGVVEGVIAALLIAFAAGLIGLTVWCYRKRQAAIKASGSSYSDDGEGYSFVAIPSGICAAAVFVIACCLAYNAALSILAPEYVALREILGALK